jgi:hypothetical protein
LDHLGDKMSDGGKGDARRPLHVTKEQFESNWDAIFKGKTMTTFTTQDRQDAQRTPLTEEQIIGIRMSTEGDIIAFARAIERAHGIGE